MIFNDRQRAAIVVLLILLAINVGLHPQAADAAVAGESSIVKIGRLLSYVLIPLLILEQWKKVVYVATRNISLLALVGLATISFLWSDGPSATIDTSKGLIRTTLFGIYLASQYSIKEQLQLVAKAIAIAAVLSFIIAVALPAYGVMNPLEGQTLGWRGIFPHKNDLGDVMATGTAIFVVLSCNATKHRWIFWPVIFLMIALLILANAKTPLIGLVTMLALMPFHNILRQKYTLKVPLIIGAIIFTGTLAVWLNTNFDAFLTGIGKDPGLNGRADIWTIIITMIQKRPWIGYGYNGFWANSVNVNEVHRQYFSSWKPGHAHNGLLTLLLDVGIVGLILFSFNLFNTLKNSILFARFSKSIEGIWPIQLLAMLINVNVSGNFILNSYGSIVWLLYTTLVFSLSIHKDRAKRQAHLSDQLHRSPDPIVSSQKVPALSHNNE
jgi:exopolysaccharide production protein ExoQ